jgi:transmembrane sensor
VRLEDGSTVDLNSQSKVRVRFGENRRSVELLEGQALFRVTKDTSRPFIVATDNTHVRAVGTQFDVYRKPSGTVVTVIEGRVAVLPEIASSVNKVEDLVAPSVSKESSRPQTPTPARKHSVPSSDTHTSGTDEIPTALMPQQGEILLAAGEQVTVAPKSVSPPHEADLSLATAWTQRKIAFKATPLSEVVEEFNRYNTRQLVIGDPGLKTTKISGVFSSTDPDSLLRFLRELPNISVEETGGDIRIVRN